MKRDERTEVTPGGTVIRRWTETLDCGCVAKFTSKDRAGSVEDIRRIVKPCEKHG